MTAIHDVTSDRITIAAACHGSTARYAISEEDIEDGKLDDLFDWARSLFVLDASPDMRELLKYNREPWVFA